MATNFKVFGILLLALRHFWVGRRLGGFQSLVDGNGNNFFFQGQLQQYNNPKGIVPYTGFRSQAGVAYSCLENDRNPNRKPCSYIATFMLVSSSQSLHQSISANSLSITNGNTNFASATNMSSSFFAQKPNSLMISLFSTGSVFNPNGQPVSTNNLVLVDTFLANIGSTVPLTSTFPANAGFTTSTFSSSLSNNTMTTKWALRCGANAGVGPNCDLTCSSKGACTKTVNGQLASFSCQKWVAVDPNQFFNCTTCHMGVNNSTGLCNGYQKPTTPFPGSSSAPNNNNLIQTVPQLYYTLTIVFAVIAGVGLLLLVIVSCLYCRNRENINEAMTARRREEWSAAAPEPKSSGSTASYRNNAFVHSNPDPNATRMSMESDLDSTQNSINHYANVAPLASKNHGPIASSEDENSLASSDHGTLNESQMSARSGPRVVAQV